MSSETPETSTSLRRKIVSGTVILLSGSSLATLVNLLYNIAVAHFLGPNGFGHATAVYTLLTITSAITLAFQIVSAKAIAQESSQQASDAAYRKLHRIAWGSGLLLAGLLLVFQESIVNFLNLPSWKLVAFLAVATAFYVPLGTRRGYIQGAFGFRRLATNLILEGVVRLVGSLVMIALGFGVVGVILANAAAMAAAYGAIRPKLSAPIPSSRPTAHWVREIFQGTVFYSGQVLINNCDIVLVTHFFSAMDAGLYAAIAMVGRVTFAFSTAVSNSMFPVVARAGKEHRKNLTLIATALSIMLGGGVILVAGLWFTPAWIWTVFFGARFSLPGPYGFPYLLALYAFTTIIYSLSVIVITYEMSYKIANTSWVQLAMSGVLVAGICRFHDSLQQVILVQLVLMFVLLISVAVPFLIDILRRDPSVEPSEGRALRLLQPFSEDQVILEFLKSDFENAAYSKYHDVLRDIIFAGDLQNRVQCAQRRALLFLRHRPLWNELPKDTQWFEAELNLEQLQNIRAFPRAHWRKLARGNFSITWVAERVRDKETKVMDSFVAKISDIRERLSDGESTPGSVLLIGIDESHPFTILDGNHRFVSAFLEGKSDRLRIVCGLSPHMDRCCWYQNSFFNIARYARNLVVHGVKSRDAALRRLLEANEA